MLVGAGAVVAREYGLPCVVNVSNATVLFNSGHLCYCAFNTLNAVQFTAVVRIR